MEKCQIYKKEGEILDAQDPRVINGLARLAISTVDVATVEIQEQASRDNLMIKDNLDLIQMSMDYLARQNDTMQPYHQHELRIDELVLEIAQLKISGKTADDITKNRQPKPSATIKLPIK